MVDQLRELKQVLRGNIHTIVGEETHILVVQHNGLRHTVIIDTDDLHILQGCTLGIASNGGKLNYIRCSKGGLTDYLHRVIMSYGSGVEDTKLDVDHINNNTLDNRRSNLRFCTRSQNL